MSKSYEERMAEKYNFLNKDNEKQDNVQNDNKEILANEPEVNEEHEGDTVNEEACLFLWMHGIQFLINLVIYMRQVSKWQKQERELQKLKQKQNFLGKN